MSSLIGFMRESDKNKYHLANEVLLHAQHRLTNFLSGRKINKKQMLMGVYPKVGLQTMRPFDSVAGSLQTLKTCIEDTFKRIKKYKSILVLFVYCILFISLCYTYPPETSTQFLGIF